MVTEPNIYQYESFLLQGGIIDRLREIQSEWGLETLQEALEHAINICPERYGDD